MHEGSENVSSDRLSASADNSESQPQAEDNANSKADAEVDADSETDCEVANRILMLKNDIQKAIDKTGSEAKKKKLRKVQ